jgi:hypothetical protein
MEQLVGASAAAALLAAHPAGLAGQGAVVFEVLRAILAAQTLNLFCLLGAHRPETPGTAVIVRHTHLLSVSCKPQHDTGFINQL